MPDPLGPLGRFVPEFVADFLTPDAPPAKEPAAQAPSSPAAPAATPPESRMDRVGRILGAKPPVVASPEAREQAILCPVLGAMVAQGKIKLDANGNMSTSDFRKMLARDMGFSAPLAFMTASAGIGANKPSDILGNLFGARMNPLELRGGMVKHPGDSMILENGTFDEEKFQALARHARDKKVVDGKVVSGRLTVEDLAAVVKANVDRDAARSGKPQGQALGVAEFGAVVTMFGERNPRTGEREISVETLRNLYQSRILPKPSGTAANPTTVRDYVSVMAEMTRKMPGATPSGLARDGARVAAGIESPAITPAMLGAAKGVCPHMQGVSSGSAPVNAAELRAVAGVR